MDAQGFQGAHSPTHPQDAKNRTSLSEYTSRKKAHRLADLAVLFGVVVMMLQHLKANGKATDGTWVPLGGIGCHWSVLGVAGRCWESLRGVGCRLAAMGVAGRRWVSLGGVSTLADVYHPLILCVCTILPNRARGNMRCNEGCHVMH